MKKILVTTDFSKNSTAAVNFAKKLAMQGCYQLTVFHASHLMQPSMRSESARKLCEDKEFANIQKKLATFVRESSSTLDKTPAKTHFAISNCAPASKAITNYAVKHHYDFICISTNGAGRFKRMLGSVVSQLIKHCPVPVILVPAEHNPLSTAIALWASDFTQLENELTPAVEFAKSLGASLHLLHLLGPQDANVDPNLIRQMIWKRTPFPVELHLMKSDWSKPLLHNIQSAVREIAPSVLLLFSNQDKTFLEGILYPSITESYVYKSLIPVVIFKKQSILTL
jgi:nucleotide-binding universal stress UspA family protein